MKQSDYERDEQKEGRQVTGCRHVHRPYWTFVAD